VSQRLHKVLAQAGVCSRRAAEKLIEAGRVQVNGRVVTRLGTCVLVERDEVRVDGRPLARSGAPAERIYLMLNKPRGYLTTLSDPQGRPTVAELLRGVRRRVFPVGRLDYDSEGLLLVTNDGELARELMHPGRGVAKTYAVQVRGRPDSSVLHRLAGGIPVDGRRTSAEGLRLVRPGENSWLELTVREGRKHLVRRMLQIVGHPVIRLQRVRFDGLSLGRLGRGEWRPLSSREVARLRRHAGASRPDPGRS
jgi:23S rRNA pseudouridine2605 synthase/16S rRNA pseudouridine516 synthase